MAKRNDVIEEKKLLFKVEGYVEMTAYNISPDELSDEIKSNLETLQEGDFCGIEAFTGSVEYVPNKKLKTTTVVDLIDEV